MSWDFEGEYQALTSDGPAGRGRREAIEDVFDDADIRRMQRRHFLLFDVLPLAGTLLALALLPVFPIGWTEIGLFFVMWLLTGFGISVGYHRLFSHRAFKAPAWISGLLAVFGAMAGQGAVLSWVVIHRRHHQFADLEGDPHSPNLAGSGFRGRLRGFIHAHLTWMAAHPYPNVVRYVPDLLRDRMLVAINRNYYRWILLGFAIPAVVDGVLTGSWVGFLNGFLWGGVVRMFVLEHATWSLNSLCHMFGTSRFNLRDRSRNIGWMAFLNFGESWHHNHHAFPSSASFGLAWYRIDPGYWLIRFLEIVGLARDVRVPTPEQIGKRAAAARLG
jgi:stearoyl-CoA desaturase (delta-9 desaturase)